MTRYLFAALMVVAISCAGKVPSHPTSGIVEISVHGQETVPLEGAHVYLYAGKAPIDLGITRADGYIHVARSTLAAHPHGVIVACARRYFCGALPLDQDELIRFDEMHVGLQAFFLK